MSGKNEANRTERPLFNDQRKVLDKLAKPIGSDGGLIEKETIAIADDAGREWLIGTRFSRLSEFVVIGLWDRLAERYRPSFLFRLGNVGWGLVDSPLVWPDEHVEYLPSPREWVKRFPEFKQLFYPLGSLSTAWLSVTGSLAPLLTPMAINPRAALALIGRTQEGLATKDILEERIEAAERLEPDPQPQMTSPLEKEPADEDFIT